MTAVVISQPMLFPWPGLFEQIMLADVYVHHDDAQFSQSSFTRRIQVKNGAGVTWMTIPLKNRLNMHQRINELEAADEPWKRTHRNLLLRTLRGAPFLDDAIALFDSACQQTSVCDLLMASIEEPCRYLGIGGAMTIARTSTLGIGERSWQRVLKVTQAFGGTRYITGHGAANYLDHEAFEAAGIAVDYMNYSRTPWPQFGDAFTPFVTILDLIAHTGPNAVDCLRPATVDWRAFLQMERIPA
ncbi:hypothetical protein W911_02665 [Hyphomicrobium nitrativorans NL23]|uniref:WbqC n=1 Tax=Hyphomicrobium nitrativorans NL23 TaxID=1029756 RepID=V5SC03_9HYPH|nr:WbqC family protein [Hyphomicrobium nitrativorans]AHB47560.1 hypothetical protein W911_02665 [Hyphomicrobium nitrativorans NL23]